MPIFDEVWEDNDYAYRQYQNLKTLPKNHVGKLSTLKFDFVEYKTNHQVSCHLYERMRLLCMNQYGLMRNYMRRECLDIANYFDHCVKLNTALGVQRKYFPENFAINPYSRPVPNVNELYIGTV